MTIFVRKAAVRILIGVKENEIQQAHKVMELCTLTNVNVVLSHDR